MDREMSYMCAIVKDAEELREVGKMLEWLSNAPGIKLLSHEKTKEGITLTLTVDELEYEAQIYPVKPEIPQMYRTQHLFPDVDLEALDKAQAGLAVDMEFGEDALESYHAQLRVVNALVPNAVAVLDHSAEKLLSGRWVSLAAASKVHPAPRYIYIVQAVSGEDSCVWLHSHGLNRCGITELEILNSTTDTYQEHYNILETMANRLLEEKQPELGEPFFLARLEEQIPLIVTLIDWEDAVEWYPEDMLGGKNDRKESHNSNTSCVFVYATPDNLENRTCSPVSVYDELLKGNPIYMLTTHETERMKQLAAERLPYMLKAFENKENKILVKIGLTIDEEFLDEQNEFEHIWFELLDVKEDSLYCELTQEPYYVKDMHEGSTGTYSFDRVTDWLIYTKERRISADDVYLLDY